MADIIPPAPVDAPFGSYNWADWYIKIRNAINNAGAVTWTSITGTPTTLTGYGITDAVRVTVGTLKVVGSLTNGAGASAGTLTNAPSVGNPTKWLIVDDNGVSRRIPSW